MMDCVLGILKCQWPTNQVLRSGSQKKGRDKHQESNICIGDRVWLKSPREEGKE